MASRAPVEVRGRRGPGQTPPSDGTTERAAREARRLRAAELLAQGRTQAEVAHQLGVSRQSAHVWHARFLQGGVDALHSRGPTGPDPKLTDAQLPRVEQALAARRPGQPV